MNIFFSLNDLNWEKIYSGISSWVTQIFLNLIQNISQKCIYTSFIILIASVIRSQQVKITNNKAYISTSFFFCFVSLNDTIPKFPIKKKNMIMALTSTPHIPAAVTPVIVLSSVISVSDSPAHCPW